MFALKQRQNLWLQFSCVFSTSRTFGVKHFMQKLKKHWYKPVKKIGFKGPFLSLFNTYISRQQKRLGTSWILVTSFSITIVKTSRLSCIDVQFYTQKSLVSMFVTWRFLWATWLFPLLSCKLGVSRSVPFKQEVPHSSWETFLWVVYLRALWLTQRLLQREFIKNRHL